MSYTHDQKPQSPSEELFGEIISSYTDAEALDDGVLVAMDASPVNRVTRAVFDHCQLTSSGTVWPTARDRRSTQSRVSSKE